MPPMRVKIVVSLGKVHCNDKLRDRKLLPRLKIILPSSELLRGVRCFEIDVSGLYRSRNVGFKTSHAAL